MDTIYTKPIFFGLIGITTMILTYATLNQQIISSENSNINNNISNIFSSNNNNNIVEQLSTQLTGGKRHTKRRKNGKSKHTKRKI